MIKRGMNLPLTRFWLDTALVAAKKPQIPPARPIASGTDSAANRTQLESGVGPQQVEESWWNWFGTRPYNGNPYKTARIPPKTKACARSKRNHSDRAKKPITMIAMKGMTKMTVSGLPAPYAAASMRALIDKR